MLLLGYINWFSCFGAWRRDICCLRDLLAGIAVSVPRGEVYICYWRDL